MSAWLQENFIIKREKNFLRINYRQILFIVHEFCKKFIPHFSPAAVASVMCALCECKMIVCQIAGRYSRPKKKKKKWEFRG